MDEVAGGPFLGEGLAREIVERARAEALVFRLAHRITVLHRGAVIADGDPATVKADEGVRDAYLGGFDEC